MDLRLCGLKMDRKSLNQITRMERKMGFLLVGMKMDRRGMKEILRVEKKMDFGLIGIKKGMLLKLKHTKTVR